MDWFTKRIKEPTTWGGLGLLAAAIGQIAGRPDVAEVGRAATETAAHAVSQGLPLWQSAVLALAGGVMALRKERNDTQ